MKKQIVIKFKPDTGYDVLLAAKHVIEKQIPGVEKVEINIEKICANCRYLRTDSDKSPCVSCLETRNNWSPKP